MRLTRGLNDGISGGIPVGKFAVLAHVYVVQGPCVLERGPRLPWSLWELHSGDWS